MVTARTDAPPHVVPDRQGYPELALYVDGTWIGAGERESIDVEDPATRGVAGHLPSATDADLDRALAAAARAFPSWRDRSPYERAVYLQRAASFLRERADAIARAMTIENGKPIWESRDEVHFTAEIVEFLAAQGARSYGTVVPGAAADGQTLLLREPVGPVAAFTTWNYPLIVPARKIAAALAAGCTIVLKPAEETPASALALAHALHDAGLPAGVLNVVLGDPTRISQRLISSPLTRKVSFTGSTAVGKQLASLAGQRAKPVMLELGGHAPLIAFDDVDPVALAEMTVGSKFHNSGQSCGSPVRFYLHERIHDAFVERFAELASRLPVGDGLVAENRMGALANKRRLDAMAPIVEDALARGAELACGGDPIAGSGYWFQPTLLARAPDDAAVMTEEPFGPIGATATFTDEDEVVARANSLPYGLGAYVFTGSADQALRVPRRIEAGMVSVNKLGMGGRDTYFGGVKESGFGSDGGPQAVEEYLTYKLVMQG